LEIGILQGHLSQFSLARDLHPNNLTLQRLSVEDYFVDAEAFIEMVAALQG